MKKLINIITTLALVLCAVPPVTTAYAADMPNETFYDDNVQTLGVEPVIGPAVMYLNGATLYADGSKTYMVSEDGTHIPVRVIGSHYFYTECNGDEVCIDDSNLTLTQPTVETVNGIDVYTDKNGDSFVYDGNGELRAAEKLENGNLAFFDKDHNIVFFMPNGHFCVLGALVDTVSLSENTTYGMSISCNQSIGDNTGIGFNISDNMGTNSSDSMSISQNVGMNTSSISIGSPISIGQSINDNAGHNSSETVSLPVTLSIYTDWNGNLYYNDNGIDRPLAEYEGAATVPIDLLPASEGYIVSK